jgi:hypothetical protein
MKQKRPGIVLTIAILHLVGGGLGLVLVLCSGIGLAMQSSMKSTMAAGNPQDPGVRVQAQLQQKIPSMQKAEVGAVIVNLVLSVMLIAAGIGLLAMHNWARILSIVYASLSILHKLGFLVFQLAVVYPVLSAFVDAEIQKMPPAQASGFAVGAKGAYFGVLAVQTALIVYLIIVLAIMLMPSVKRAFANRPRRYHDDEDDEDFGRRVSRRDDDFDEDDRPRRRPSRRDDDDSDDDDRRRDRGSDRFRS